MGVRRTSGEEFSFSDPINSFVDVVRWVILQPARFFAALPRRGSLLNPLVFALICIEISAILGGLMVLVGTQQNPGFNPHPQNIGLPSLFAPGSPVVSIVLAPVWGAYSHRYGALSASSLQPLSSSFWSGW